MLRDAVTRSLWRRLSRTSCCCRCSMNFPLNVLLMTEIGSATMTTPVSAHSAPNSCPSPVVGYISPYPTVVMVTTAHQKEWGIERNVGPSWSCSSDTKTSAEKRIVKTIRQKKSSPSSLEHAIPVLARTSIPSECRVSLNTRSTRRTLSSFAPLKSLAAGTKKVIYDGKMAMTSTTLSPWYKKRTFSTLTRSRAKYSTVKKITTPKSTLSRIDVACTSFSTSGSVSRHTSVTLRRIILIDSAENSQATVPDPGSSRIW
mmetsp:Transcript_61711/g.151894  ORF Transcript_61711/g.151894 Transcript_61711/m.151894 type:complete len:258 (+) Transcript_61711:196-969(+)